MACVKTALLMRHAKSDWDVPGVDDFDRPLSRRGLADAPRMGIALAKAGVVPERIVASPAVRARRTAELAAEAGGVGAKVELDEALYQAPGETWIEVLRRLPASCGTALVVAHSPGIVEAAATLIGGRARLRLPTAAVACVDLDVGRWGEIGPGDGELRWLLVPKLVKAIG